MDEKQLEDKFIAFLYERGYPKESILTQVPLVSTNGIRHQPDLLIVDTEIDEYIGLVEFKSKPDFHAAFDQVSQYLKFIGSKSTPAFFVTPKGEDDFSIFNLINVDEWSEIEKADFPTFSALSSKKQIEDKQFRKEIEKEKLNAEYAKSKKAKQASFWALISAFLGIAFTIITISFSDKKFKGLGFSEKKTCCDSLSIKINALEQKLTKFNNSPNASSVVDTIKFIDSSKTYTRLEKRLKVVETGISTDPERTLSILRINSELSQIKEIIEHKSELERSGNESIEKQIEYLNSAVLGIVLAIFSAALGIFITYNWKGNGD
jgi:hypothetical protein